MTEFIANNYPIIIIVSVFLIFALIGFVIDTAKNKKDTSSFESDREKELENASGESVFVQSVAEETHVPIIKDNIPEVSDQQQGIEEVTIEENNKMDS